MVYKFFDKKTSGSGIKNENISNKELAEELHKPVIEFFYSNINVYHYFTTDLNYIFFYQI